MSPKELAQRIKAWSYSKFNTYEECPYKAKLVTIDRMKEPENAAIINGNIVHGQAEQFVTGKLPTNIKDFPDSVKQQFVKQGKKLPSNLKRFEAEFNQLRNFKAIAEQMWGFTRDWEPCAWNDWNRCWLRVKVDVHYMEQTKVGKINRTVLHIVDHKTGRPRESHQLQRSLYGLGAMLMYPDVSEVRASHWYIEYERDATEARRLAREQLGTRASSMAIYNRTQELIAKPVIDTSVYTPGDVEKLKKDWERRTKPMLNDTSFVPRPGYYCGYCFFSKKKNGPCKY